MPALIDVSGKKYGRLFAIKKIGISKCGNIVWQCVCECGRRLDIRSSLLINGNTKSCGCFQKEEAVKRLTTHGQTGTRTYRIWAGMLSRCRNKKSRDYRYYGGRGISVCRRWLKFKNFLSDMGPAKNRLTIDRINNDGDYEPINCRWATYLEQAQNKRAYGSAV